MAEDALKLLRMMELLRLASGVGQSKLGPTPPQFPTGRQGSGLPQEVISKAQLPQGPQQPQQPQQDQTRKVSFFRNLMTDFIGTLASDLKTGAFQESVGAGLQAGTRRGGTAGQAFSASFGTLPGARRALEQLGLERESQQALTKERKARTKSFEETVVIDTPQGQVAVPRKDIARVLGAQANIGQREKEFEERKRQFEITSGEKKRQFEAREQRVADQFKKNQAIAQRRTEIMEKALNLPRGSGFPVLDADGVMTGDVVFIDPRNRSVQVLNASEDIRGKRGKPATEAQQNRKKSIAVTEHMIDRIDEAATALLNGEEIVKNATSLNAQLATLGQIAKGLGGEAGVLATQDIERAKATIPGVVESLSGNIPLVGDVARTSVEAKINNLRAIMGRVRKTITEGLVQQQGGSTPSGTTKPTHRFNPATGKLEPIS